MPCVAEGRQGLPCVANGRQGLPCVAEGRQGMPCVRRCRRRRVYAAAAAAAVVCAPDRWPPTPRGALLDFWQASSHVLLPGPLVRMELSLLVAPTTCAARWDSTSRSTAAVHPARVDHFGLDIGTPLIGWEVYLSQRWGRGYGRERGETWLLEKA